MAAPITILPREIIQNIVAYSEIGDVLSLGQTCRRLRFACDDLFVFQTCFLRIVGEYLVSPLLADSDRFELTGAHW